MGIAWAFLSAVTGMAGFTADWIEPFGDIFLRILKVIAVPLVGVSVLKGVISLSDIRTLGITGLKTLGLYFATTILAVTVGLLLVNLVAPGSRLPEDQRLQNRASYEAWVQRTDQVEILDSVVPAGSDASMGIQDRSPLSFLVEAIPDNIFGALSGGAMLQIIVFAILFGLAFVLVPAEKTKGLRDLLDGIDSILLVLVHHVMYAAPFFVFCLLAGKTSAMAGDEPSRMVAVFEGLGWYSVTVLAGLAFMLFFIYPAMAWTFGGRHSYAAFFRAMSPAQLMAFSTSSSAATLPVTMECVNKRLGISQQTTDFVLPIGATINMDGTSLYQAVAVVFLAQFHAIDLTIIQQTTIVLTATLASIGAAAVPSAGLVTMVLVMQSVGLNPAWISFIVPVDRILDMCRTVVNVSGDAVVCSIMDNTRSPEV